MHVNLREVFAIYAVCCTDIFVGIVYGFSAQVTPYLQSSSSDIKLKAHELSWIATAGLMARPIGALVDIFLIDSLGRRGTLRITASLSIIGWAVIALSPNFITLCLGRFITGYAVGMIASSAVYLSEIARPAYRSLLLTLMSLMFLLGLGVIYVMNYLFHWRVTSGILSTSWIVFLLQLYVIPESFYWYVSKKQYEKARQAYKWITKCNDEVAIDEKIKEIEASFKTVDCDSSFLSKWKTPLVYRSFSVIFFMNIFRMGTMFEVFYAYAVDMYVQLQTPYDIHRIVAAFGVANVFAAVFVCYLVFQFEKRTILMIVAFVMSFLIGYVFLVCGDPLVDLGNPLMKVICFSLFMMLANVFYGQLIWTLIAELSPTCVRGQMFSIITSFMHIGAITLIELYGSVGSLVPFKWLALVMFISNAGVFVVSWLFLPKTKGKSILEIEEYFSR